MQKKTGLLFLLFTFLTSLAAAQGSQTYEVTVTNLTRAQILSPALTVVHLEEMPPLFQPGEAASEELAAIAEDAIYDPMLDLLSASPYVLDFNTTDGVIPPGESRTVTVQAGMGPGVRTISLVGMLVTTNDAFYGLSAAKVPFFVPFLRFDFSQDHDVPAYDAGSEANVERCAEIPGPPCGNAEVPVEDVEAEGFVHVHGGIHGVGDLDPAEWDWRNPVARVTIRVIRGN